MDVPTDPYDDVRGTPSCEGGAVDYLDVRDAVIEDLRDLSRDLLRTPSAGVVNTSTVPRPRDVVRRRLTL
jgi:hypothetical protein